MFMILEMRTFDGELSTQQSLAALLFRRSLDALQEGDPDSFRYASEIHDETLLRISDIESARASIQSAFEEHEQGRPPHRALGALALGGMILNGELRLA